MQYKIMEKRESKDGVDSKSISAGGYLRDSIFRLERFYPDHKKD